MAPFMHEAVAHRSKRVRFSNEPSPPPSALASTNAADDKTTKVVDEDATSDSDSTLSESSEEPSSESSSEEDDDDDDDDSDNDNDNGKDTEMALDEPTGPDGVVNLRANRGKKPIMKLTPEEMGPDIRGFLKDFLPKLKAANEELIAQKKAGTLRSLDAGDQDEGEPYIEMDLGLGVLEEKDPNANSDTDSASDADDDDTAEKDVLGRLMGRQKKQDPAGIEVLQNYTSS